MARLRAITVVAALLAISAGSARADDWQICAALVAGPKLSCAPISGSVLCGSPWFHLNNPPFSS